VRTHKHNQSRKKPIQAVETHGHKKQHRKRQHKRDLHREAIERILSAQGRKDEESPDDNG